MTQPAATMIPPKATISLGPRWAPRLSTIQPSTGVSQVSRAIKIVNASVIAARVSKCHQRKSKFQALCASLIGLTKSVHPYCRLAIITMQMMQEISCHQRDALDADALD